MKWQVINKNCEKQGAEYTALRNPMLHKRHVRDATTQIDKLVSVRQIRLEPLHCFASNTIYFQKDSGQASLQLTQTWWQIVPTVITWHCHNLALHQCILSAHIC